VALYHSYSDEQLVALLKTSDAQAFTELYNRYWPSVYRNAMKLLRSAADAEDAVQQLFESLWIRREKLEIRGAFAAYLFSSTRYISLHIVEMNIAQYTCVSSLAEVFDQPVISVVESGMDAKMLESRIEAIVEALPGKMQEVFRLSRQEHMTHKEIAEKLQISEETVKKQVYNALKMIRQHLGDSVSLGVLLATVYAWPH